jgi:hypothetical protein
MIMRIFRASRLATALPAVLLAAGAALLSSTASADSVSGTVAYQSKAGAINVNVKNVYLVKGPDAMAGKSIRRLIFTSADLGAKIKACATMSCSDNDLREGLEVSLDSGPRLNYWFVGNDQRVQYSGTAVPATLQLTTDTPQRLAGKLTIDDSAAGGVKASIDFDAALLKEFTK